MTLFAASLLGHRRLFHHIANNLKEFPCPTCGKMFYLESHMRKHVTVHTGERNYMCDLCGKEFRNSEALCNHKNHVHFGRFPYRCKKCGHGIKKKKRLEVR